jgi:hypothetical protein
MFNRKVTAPCFEIHKKHINTRFVQNVDLLSVKRLVVYNVTVGWVALPVQRLLDGTGIESPWEARIYAPVQTGPEARSASCTMGTGSLPGVRCGRGVRLTPHTLLVPKSKIE